MAMSWSEAEALLAELEQDAAESRETLAQQQLRTYLETNPDTFTPKQVVNNRFPPAQEVTAADLRRAIVSGLVFGKIAQDPATRRLTWIGGAE